jgi:hypothetical protein
MAMTTRDWERVNSKPEACQVKGFEMSPTEVEILFLFAIENFVSVGGVLFLRFQRQKCLRFVTESPSTTPHWRHHGIPHQGTRERCVLYRIQRVKEI